MRDAILWGCGVGSEVMVDGVIWLGVRVVGWATDGGFGR